MPLGYLVPHISPESTQSSLDSLNIVAVKVSTTNSSLGSEGLELFRDCTG